MAETHQSILQNLKNKQYAPVYFLQGEETYYIDQISNYIEANALDEGLKSFNQIITYGKESDLQTILTQAREFPMMAERRVVIVKEAQELATISKEQGEKLLTHYLENQQTSTVLVFCYKYKPLDKRKKLAKALDKHAVVLEAKKMYDNQLPDWVSGYIKDKGRKIEQKAVFVIVENIGNNITRIANEIDKMLGNLAEDAIINSDDVYKNIGVSKEYNVFELQKALAFKNILKANQIIKYFESDPKSNPLIPIVTLLFSFYTKLLLVHHAKDKSEWSIASVLKVNPFFVKEYLMAANNYSLVQTIQKIGFIKDADLQSKGIGQVSMKEGAILKELIFKLLH